MDGGDRPLRGAGRQTRRARALSGMQALLMDRKFKLPATPSCQAYQAPISADTHATVVLETETTFTQYWERIDRPNKQKLHNFH